LINFFNKNESFKKELYIVAVYKRIYYPFIKDIADQSEFPIQENLEFIIDSSGLIEILKGFEHYHGKSDD